MADSTLTVSINADTSELGSDLGAAVNQFDAAFQAIKLSAAEVKSPIGQLFKSLQTSSDQAVAGIIKGTETWQRAVLNVAQSLEIKFAQLAVNRLINWVETETLSLAATEAKNAAVTASDTSTADSGIAAQASHAVASILSDAKQVFGGIFAFLAPTMGPAAVAPAAAGEATVAALASGITYAESGAWNIPSNTLAYLHAGEMVVPQSFASSLRNGGGLSGGGDNYTINVNAIDTQTGAQFLKNNASVIASTLSMQARNFNKNVPTWKS